MGVKRLYPECKDYIWGGSRLIERYGKKGKGGVCAESWELSMHENGPSRLADGKTLRESVGAEELGANAAGFESFPVLVKLIDARSDLSVQVHPSDAYARIHENSPGKTETWYIVEAGKGAAIYLGFSRDVTREEFEKSIADGTVAGLLEKISVKKGEAYFIPAGTVHAICAGCLICEIQQNSDVTYRVYDYGRLGADGRPRRLHVEKALAVAELSKTPRTRVDAKTPFGRLFAASRYFSAYEYEVSGGAELFADGGSFLCLTCVSGNGNADGEEVRAGDSFFVPAGDRVFLTGKFTFIVTAVRKYFLGVDLGGTNIKCGVVDDLGNVIVSGSAPTERKKGADAVCENIASLAKVLLSGAGMSFSDLCAAGVGAPGTIDGESGTVLYSNNLGWEDFPIAKKLGELTGLPVTVANDANAAALGEYKFGAGRGYSDVVMLTLGTGVGGGFITNGRLYTGHLGAGAEFGHSVIVKGGELCTCGRRGCLEAYASATALKRDTARAMREHPESAMWEKYTPETVSGRTAFEYASRDPAAKGVVENYVSALACGVTDVANLLRPDVVILGGGISGEKERLTDPVQRIVDAEIFGGGKGPRVKIVTAELGGSVSGVVGAASLCM